MARDVRRQAIVDATRPLLMEHGRATTTKLIAEAAGIAEGTVFRVFVTKEELFDEVLAQALDPEPLMTDLVEVDRKLPLRDRLLALTELMQRRFVSIFELMTVMGLPKPPVDQFPRNADWRRRALEAMVAVLEPDADQFRLPLCDVVRSLRLLTFAGSHPHISEQKPLSPDQIVDLILHGTLKGAGS